MALMWFIIIVVILVVMVRVVVRETQPEPEQHPANEPSGEDAAANVELMMAKVEAMVQAAESGHENVHQQLLDGSYEGPLPERRSDGAWTSIFDDLRILSIAGINHRQGIIRYTGRNTVALVPEPKNEFDPNAIKVVAEDGHHLGYIRMEQTEMVRSWAREKFPFYCIGMIQEHEDENDGHRFYTGYLYIKKAVGSHV